MPRSIPDLYGGDDNDEDYAPVQLDEQDVSYVLDNIELIEDSYSSDSSPSSSSEEEEEEKPPVPSKVEGDEELTKCSDVGGILKIWEERLVQPTTNNATNAINILTRLSEVIEYESLEYLKMDPDPFDDRHPSRTHPDCSLGHSLKTLFKKETFMTKLVHEYLKENWAEGMDLAVNTAACRLFVNILPGLETSVVYQETEGLILKLFTWAESAPEPLKSYSLGLLGASMEIPEIAGKFKEKNIHLVQIMLQRLRQLQTEFFMTISKNSRHFSQFSANKLPPVSEEAVIDPIAEQVVSIASKEVELLDAGVAVASTPPPRNRPSNSTDSPLFINSIQQTPSTPKTSANTNSTATTPKTPANTISATTTPKSAKKSRGLERSAHKHFLEPSLHNRAKRRKLSVPNEQQEAIIDDCSTSSSWAELEPNIIGSWQVFPVNLVTRQIFTLRYLCPLGEYQEMLGYAFEQNAIQLILKYLSKSNQTKETSRLTFEALKYLGALLCHKKFALEFLQSGGLQKLLQVPRPSLSATGVSLSLYYIAYSEDAMEKVCLMPRAVLINLMAYAIWLLECAHHSGRNHAIMFFGVIYPFKTMLDIFDSQDGLRAILNGITTQPSFLQIKRSIDGGLRDNLGLNSAQFLENGDEEPELSEEEQLMSKQTVRQVSFNLKRYFECHLGFTADKLRRTMGKNHATQHVTGPALPPYKALKPFTSSELNALHSTVQELLPVSALRWAPVDRFLTQAGLETVMQTIAMAYEWNYSGRGETIRNMLDVLAVACLLPRTQLMLTERYKVSGSSEHSGMSIILSAAEGEVVNEPDVKKSALQVIGNCVCGPIHHKRPTETQIKVWEATRISNGILILTRLLQTKSPITDADCIRSLAVWCLSGLARYRQIRQVLQQLPLIRSGCIQSMMTEPILQDNRAHHATFQKHAMEIIKLVHGKEDSFSLDFGDVIRKSDLISQSRVDYYPSDLTELIHDHLVKAGLSEAAAVLQMEAKTKQNHSFSSSSNSSINLDSIVRQYLLNQHALCKTPMITCPTFELLKPHKCPSSGDRPRISDFRTHRPNFGARFSKRELGGNTRTHGDRKLIYSKYKPFRVIRSADIGGDEEINFTAVAYSPCYQWTIVGTSNGDVKLFNNSTTVEDGNYPCHDSEIYHVQPNSKCSLLLTSNIWRRPLSALWRMEGLFDKLLEFERDEYVEFSKINQDKVITTNSDTTSIYDVETLTKVLTLKPRMSNQYLKNRATFDPYDELILSDGVLWDFKSGKEIHKFDKLNENLNGMFNPKSGLEIISNTEIWDVRTFHLLKTVRQLDQCALTFTNDGSIIYGVKIEREEHPSEGKLEFRSADTSFVVLDNLDDYSSIATIELKRHIMGIATSPNDLQLALVENHVSADDTLTTQDSCVRYYEVGRSRQDELTNADGVEDEDDIQSDDDEDVDEDDDDDDDDGLGDDDDSNDDDDDEGGDRDNDLDQLLDQLLDPSQRLYQPRGDGHNENVALVEEGSGSSGSSWNEEDDEEVDSSSEDSDESSNS